MVVSVTTSAVHFIASSYRRNSGRYVVPVVATIFFLIVVLSRKTKADRFGMSSSSSSSSSTMCSSIRYRLVKGEPKQNNGSAYMRYAAWEDCPGGKPISVAQWAKTVAKSRLEAQNFMGVLKASSFSNTVWIVVCFSHKRLWLVDFL